MRLKRIDPVSLGAILAVINAAIGLLAGFFFGIFFIFVGAMGEIARDLHGPGGAFGVAMGLAMMIGMPIMYGIMGFLMGLLSGWLYNVAAKWFGGLKIELEWSQETQAGTPPMQ